MKKQIFLCLGIVFFSLNTTSLLPVIVEENDVYRKRIYSIASEEEKIEANACIEKTLSAGGVASEGINIIRAIQERAQSGTYRAGDPIAVIFYGIYGTGKTTLAENLMTFLQKKGILVEGRGMGGGFVRQFANEIFRENIEADKPCTYILDEFDQYIDQSSNQCVDDFIYWFRKAKEKNIACGQQRHFIIGTTNLLRRISWRLRRECLCIGVGCPNIGFYKHYLTNVLESMKNEHDIDVSACDSSVIQSAAEKMKQFPFRECEKIPDLILTEIIGQEENEKGVRCLEKDQLMEIIREVCRFNLPLFTLKERLYEFLYYDARNFLFGDVPYFGKYVIMKILACSGIKRFLKVNAYWPFNRFFIEKHS